MDGIVTLASASGTSRRPSGRRAGWGLTALCALGLLSAAAAQDYQEVWNPVCEPDPRGGKESCFALYWTPFHDNRLYLRAKDDGANSFFRAQMPMVDLRYAEIALRPLDKVFEMVCRGESCEASKETARTILDALPATREIQVRIFVGTGRGVVIRMESIGYGQALADTQKK